MTLIKFDKNIKDKLEKRELNPSSVAWDTLSKRLVETEDKKRIKPFWWFGLAASIAAILFVAFQFLNTTTEKSITPQIVITPNNDKPDGIDKAVKLLGQPLKTVNLQEGHSPEMEMENTIRKDLLNLSRKATITGVKTEIEQESTNNFEYKKSLQDPLTFEAEKIQDIVEQVQVLKAIKTQVTDADIETLLKQAQQEIALNTLYNESTGLVDAKRLLQEVEADLDQSFRIKVLEALKSSYGTVKTAVAQRND